MKKREFTLIKGSLSDDKIWILFDEEEIVEFISRQSWLLISILTNGKALFFKASFLIKGGS